ncbi:MAG: type II toxin-antitoxin system RelE/ParE family toxin [Lachnospiraceae bacterium]|nr:type II toxin-antitoxin system RelE/ParE family toxin [Lachnospiraceae bacterium]
MNSVDKSTKKRLKDAIEKIPFGDVKKLQGAENGYRLRVGDLRVLFTLENDIIFIDNIIPRGQAYKKL